MFKKNNKRPNDSRLDQIKFVRVTGRSLRRNGESYTIDYDAYIGYLGSGNNLICSISVDSSLFCMEEFTKDTIEFLDQQKGKIDLSDYYYAIKTDSSIGMGSILIPLGPESFKFVFEKYGKP